jgi:monoamine oxidase
MIGVDMASETEIIIVGAGAAGLMCAYELAKAGKKVLLLEARDRIGGRIWQIDDAFGVPIQAGAEFVHGAAPVTKAVVKEAGLTFIPTEIVDLYHVVNGQLVLDEGTMLYQKLLNEKLQQLKEDIPIAEFLDTCFGDDTYAELKNSIAKKVEKYDAADPAKMSTFALRKECLQGTDWEQGVIKEGYGALVQFLETECRTSGVEVLLNQVVDTIEQSITGIRVRCTNNKTYTASHAVVTVPVPIIKTIKFQPVLPQKQEAAAAVGFGGAVKVVLLFSEQWWHEALSSKPSTTTFILSKETIPTWWTPYPRITPLLVGWAAGPQAEKLKAHSSEEIIEYGLDSLATVFKQSKEELRKRLIKAEAYNWPQDQFARGAYSYPTPKTEAAISELLQPVNNQLFFAGEALYEGDQTATVEGALASGQQTARRLLTALP